MNGKSTEDLNINEQRRCLNKLDEEIEKTLQELDSLNSQTIHQAKMIHKKISSNKTQSPSRSFPLNAKFSPNASFTDSLEPGNVYNESNSYNQGPLQLSPGDLIPRDDPLKELGYGSPTCESTDEYKDNAPLQEQNSPQIQASEPGKYESKVNDAKPEKNQKKGKKQWSPARRRVQQEVVVRECNNGSTNPNKETSTLNYSNSLKSVPNMMQYHKFSNIDLPREKIHGSSKPEDFFGYHNNLRRQGINQSDKSPSGGSDVVARLLQYGRQKEERAKARMDGRDIDNKKKGRLTKAPKIRLSSSFVLTEGQKNSFYENENVSPLPSEAQYIEHIFDENSGFQETSNFNILLKKDSLSPNEITPSQLNQMLGERTQDKLVTTPQKNKIDPFYELYKEGYGNIIEARQSVNQINGCQNPHNSTAGETPEGQELANNRGSSNELLIKDLLRSKNQTKPEVVPSNKYQHVGSRYMNGVKDIHKSKSPQGRLTAEEFNKSIFRPQLSKKSLEIAAKLGNSFQRLVDTSINKSLENKKKLLKELDSELTFKPKINKMSERLDEQFKANIFNGDELHRWDQLYLMKEKYNIGKEMKKLERERQDAANEECTFQPQLNPISSRIYRDTSTQFADRATAWKDTKEKRLNKEREYRLEKEVEDCTFKPTIHGFPSRLGTSHSAISLHDMSYLTIKGLDQHFEKIDKANRMKKELEAKQEKFTGKTWRRQITIPKEFQFNKRSDSANNYIRQPSFKNLDVSSNEDKIQKNVLFLERGRDLSPHTIRQREVFNDNWHCNALEYSFTNENFGDAVIKLHHELQQMDI